MRKRKKHDQEQEAAFGPEPLAGAPRLTPLEVQQKEFRLAFRGYNERDVDEFLDHVTEELATLHEERKRLVEDSARGAGSPGVAVLDAAEASRESDEILSRAREEAADIVRKAEAGAAAVGWSPPSATSSAPSAPMSGVDTEAVSEFLGKEREFLQSLASLIQRHAESVKDIARQARESEEAESARAPEATEGAPAEEPPEEETPEEQPPEEEPTRPWASILGARQEPPVTGEGESDRVTIVDAPQPAPSPVDHEPDEPSRERVGAPASDEESRPTRVGAEPHSAGEEGERSLRELFWGEE